MYKKQMTFQRIVCLVAVIAGAIVFLYSLGMLTDLYDGLYWTGNKTANLLDEDGNKVKGPDGKNVKIQYDQVYYDAQEFNRELTVAGIGMILLGTGLFLTQSHVRRRYYVGNYVSAGLYAVGALGVAGWSFLHIHGAAGIKAQFLTMIGQVGGELQKLATSRKAPYITSTIWLDAQMAVAALLLLVTVLLIVNLIWKISLMRAEAQLIAMNKSESKEG